MRFLFRLLRSFGKPLVPDSEIASGCVSVLCHEDRTSFSLWLADMAILRPVVMDLSYEIWIE